MEQRTYVVNQQVYIATRHNSYIPGVVVKVTPKGMVDVGFPHVSIQRRFTAKGDELGAGRFGGDWIDSMGFDERTAWLASQERAKVAVNALKLVATLSTSHSRWEKAELQKEVARLEALLAAAKEKVDAI